MYGAVCDCSGNQPLGKPVIAVNTAICWHALRYNGIADKIQRLGRLLEEY